jgi:hypothetical protein
MASTINATPTSNGLIQSADNSGVLALQTGGTTAVTIDASQNVGIGDTSPSSYLGKKLVVNAGTTQNNGITIVSGNTTNTNYLFFADGTTGSDLSRGSLGYNHTSNHLQFGTNDAERMRITAIGDITQSCETLNGAYIRANSVVSVATSSTLSLTSTEAGAVIVCVYHTGLGTGGVFFGTYTGTMTKIAGDGEATDTGSGIAVYKSTNSHIITFKNKGTIGSFAFGIYSANAIR